VPEWSRMSKRLATGVDFEIVGRPLLGPQVGVLDFRSWPASSRYRYDVLPVLSSAVMSNQTSLEAQNRPNLRGP
jgi:hypothetical protein